MRATSSILSIIFVIILNRYGYSQVKNPDKKSVEITYIANEGFLIDAGGKKVLIDGLFGDKEYSFCETPDSSQRDSIINGRGIFAGIDLVAVTHPHSDHFYAPFVAVCLQNNPQTNFISCKQSVDKLAKTDQYMDIRNRVFEITPDSLTYADTGINGIDVRVYRLIHGPYYVDDPQTGEKVNRHRNIQNLGYLFTINGIKIFHCGDSNPVCASDYEHFQLEKENIDIAFLGRGFLLFREEKGLNIIRKNMQPENIIIMHISPGQKERCREVAEEVKGEFPNILVFENKMETKSYLFE